MDSEHLNAGFVRNRRFLIVVSFGIALVQILDLHFRQIIILGNVADLDHPERVMLIAWVLWGWALAQYIVWLRDVAAFTEWKQSIDESCSRSIGKELANEPLPAAVKSRLERDLFQQIPTHTLDTSLIRYTRTYIGIHGDGSVRDRAVDIQAHAFFRLPENQGEAIADIRYEKIVVIRAWRWRYWRQIVWVSVSQRFVLEYIAPFLIAFLPVYIWLSGQHWKPITIAI